MKNRIVPVVAFLCLLGVFVPLSAQYREALPGYKFAFPRDFFNHPDYQTEWWYYTGNIRAANGHRFGFELTFFRRAVSRPASSATWNVSDLYFAHFALSDLDGHRFYHASRINRAGPGLAGASESLARIWNGNWHVLWNGSEQSLRALDPRMELHLSLHPEKPPVVHGENGVSQKSREPGNASNYFSFTRMAAAGAIQLNGETFNVNGISWMDHEFFTHQLAPDQVGWDWLSIQLQDHTELMLFRLRRADGFRDPFSAGTFVDAQGKSMHLRAGDFSVTPGTQTWTSPDTKATYPISWKISVPKLGIELGSSTPLPAQEVVSEQSLIPNYWEGAISLTGRRNASAVAGVGYLEMTGYDRAVKLAP